MSTELFPDTAYVGSGMEISTASHTLSISHSRVPSESRKGRVSVKMCNTWFVYCTNLGLQGVSGRPSFLSQLAQPYYLY